MFATSVLFATAVWHALAVWHFGFFPARTLARTTRERPVNILATELFRFLAGLNFALVVLALASIPAHYSTRGPVLLALCVANASQFVIDVRVRRLGLAHGPLFQQILVGDGVFTVLNGAAFLLALCGHAGG